MLLGTSPSYSVVAQTDCTIYKIDLIDFYTIPEIYHSVITMRRKARKQMDAKLCENKDIRKLWNCLGQSAVCFVLDNNKTRSMSPPSKKKLGRKKFDIGLARLGLA